MSGPKCVFVNINDLKIPVTIYKYVKEMIISYAQDGNFGNNILNIKIDGTDVD